MTFRDDGWRDSYDAWKLATPPEYEREDPPEGDCPQCGGEGHLVNFGDPIVCDACDGSGRDPTEPCPGCNVEWADQYHGDCDICGGARRVRKLDGPSEAEIAQSQARIAAVLGIDPDEEEIAF
jgi:hypothetical protein